MLMVSKGMPLCCFPASLIISLNVFVNPIHKLSIGLHIIKRSQVFRRTID